MSELSDISKLDYLDDRTRHIINGFIRKAHKILSNNPSSFTHIPPEINTIILFFIDDHFMIYRGSYQWNITDQQSVHGILTAQQDQCFTSDVFEMSKLKWTMKLYPNGNTDANSPLGQFDLFVEILSMPVSWSYILVQQTLYCHESDTIYYYIQKYQTAECMYFLYQN